MSSIATTATYRKQMRLVRTNAMRIWVVVMVAGLLYIPWVVDQKSFLGLHLTKHSLLNMDMTALNTTLILLVGALGLNLVTGYTGMISIGNAGFFALGAIVASATGQKWWHLPFPLVLVLCGIAGAIVGAIVGLPALRIRGIYLLLATLGFHYLMNFLFFKYQTTWFGFGSVDFLRPAKLFGVTLNTEIRWYYFLLGFAAMCFLLTKNILRTRRGRAFVAVRDHEIAASAAGVNVAATRITSFAVSSSMITAAGALYAWYLGSISTDTFTLLFAIGFIAMIVIGGEGSLIGTVLGAVVWQLVPSAISASAEMSAGVSPGAKEWLNQWLTQLTLAIFGILILLVMIFQPTGLAGIWARIKAAFVRWPFTT
jgi:branched-chain amino acid transport system permease protein